MARPHLAAVVEDHFRVRLDRVLRGRGWYERLISYVGYGSEDFVRVLARIVLTRSKDTEGQLDGQAIEWHSDDPDRHRGWRVFITAPAVGVDVAVHLPTGVQHTTSDRGGYVDVRFSGHGLAPGWHDLEVEFAGRRATARVRVIGRDVTDGLVSDIDDTIVVTALPRPLIAAWNTFVRHESARKVVPGMPAFYRRLLAQHDDAPTVYLSTGAWNTAPTLIRFMDRSGYPSGPMLMTDWGPTNTGWFRSGPAHKRASLQQLAVDFPHVRWTLVGDDGQHDPGLYAEFAASHPDQVAAIAIRQLTPTEQVLSHGGPLPHDEARRRHGARDQADPPPQFRAPDGHGLAEAMLGAARD